MSSNGSLGDVTLGDVAKGLRRYQPFVLAVAAIVLVAVFLPGKTTKTTNAGLAAGSSSATPAAGQAAAGTAGGAGGGAQGGGTSVGPANGSVRGPASAPAATTTGGPANPSAPASSPAATTDPWCDPATGRLKIPTLYAAPCVPPFSGDNGGATYNGVTAQTITVAVPESNNQAQASALVAAANSTDTQAQIRHTTRGYLDIRTP